MEFHDSKRVVRARRLRESGQSYKKIAGIVRASERSVRRWCFDLGGDNSSLKRAASTRKKIFEEEIKYIKNIEIDKKTAKIILSMLYWGEGTKYPGSMSVSFSNSDPEMIRYFVKLFRYSYELDEAKFRVHLQIHTTHNKKDVFKYWSDLLNISEDKFWKPTITKPTKKMKRRNYRGTCTIRYHDYKILLRIMAIYLYISDGEMAEWLKATDC